MQASTNIRPTPGRRAGRYMPLAVLAALLIAGTVLFFASAGSDRASAAPQQFTIRPNTTWSGWSVHPPTDRVFLAEAQWRVPEVSCGTFDYRAWSKSRAAVWVGIWGKTTFDPAKVWLPQIGTNSLCVNGGGSVGKKDYVAVAQMFHDDPNGYSAGPPDRLFPVQPGDRISALVRYVGRRPDG